MTQPVAERSLVVEREMAHPPEKIWRALTEGHLIKEWLMENDFRPEVGQRFNLRTRPVGQWNGVIDGEVLAVEPHERLSYRWDVSGDDAAAGLRTVVTWTLTPSGGGTLVRMEQAGFRPEQENNYRGAAYGWQRFLDGLDRVSATLA
jgi:uncharacterized protein YndB with AHSA1/START domain